MFGKIDLKKQYRPLFTAKTTPAIIDAPTLSYWMVDGAGAPGSAAFHHAISALFAVVYSIKFSRKKAGRGPDFVVPPLEMLWWSVGEEFDLEQRPDEVRWTAMIMRPGDFIGADDVKAGVSAAKELEKKKNSSNPALDHLRLDALTARRAAQLLHVGAYSDMGPPIERLHRFISDKGLSISGKHHEVYLNDPRRTPQAKLKTILRQPVEAADSQSTAQ